VDIAGLVTVKDFLRAYMATSRGKIDDERPMADSVNTFAEWLFAGLTCATATPTGGEVYNVSHQQTHMGSNRPSLPQFIWNDPVEQGHVVNRHRPKHLFTWCDLTYLLITLWAPDDLIFIPERYQL
jgi:hypothetical protein